MRERDESQETSRCLREREMRVMRQVVVYYPFGVDKSLLNNSNFSQSIVRIHNRGRDFQKNKMIRIYKVQRSLYKYILIKKKMCKAWIVFVLAFRQNIVHVP